MSILSQKQPAAHRIDWTGIPAYDVLGPMVQLMTPPSEDDSIPCIMRGTIPPGVVVPMHSHPEPETFIQESGDVDGLSVRDDGSEWVRIARGDIFHVPGGVKHGFRNCGSVPAVAIIVTSPAIGRFFREIGTPVAADGPSAGPPSEAMLRRSMEGARKYGHWLATPEENARVGIKLPTA
jgi:quercetin dioxygenase-like cupin family protein